MSDQWLGEVIQTASSAVTLAKDGLSAVGAVRRLGASRAFDRAARDSLLRAIGMSQSGVSTYWISNDHPTIADDQPPSADLDALIGLLGRDILSALSESNFPESMREPIAALEHDLVLIGSPESEGMTRLLFGYEDSPDGLGVTRTRGALPLAYLWSEERRAGPTTLCLHIRPGGAIAARPNWPLCWQDGGELRKTRVRLREGYLAEDYLVITVLPNYVSEAALESGARIASFAGLHSVGTRAVRTLLSPAHAPVLNDLVQKIDALPPTKQGLQAVIHVDEVSHEDLQSGSVPASIRIHDVVPLYFTEGVLTRARSELEGAVAEWRESLTMANPGKRVIRRVGFDLSPPFTPRDQQLVNLVARHEPVDLDGRLASPS